MISSEKKKKKKKRKHFARSISNSGVHVIEKRSRRIWQYIIKNGYYIVRCLIYVGYMKYRGNGGWLLFYFQILRHLSMRKPEKSFRMKRPTSLYEIEFFCCYARWAVFSDVCEHSYNARGYGN